jgi:hypothetical protein
MPSELSPRAAAGRTCALVLAGVLAASHSGCETARDRYDATEVRPETDLICPGDPDGGCDFSDDAQVLAGAAKLPITPLGWENWVDADGDSEYRSGVDSFLDCGLDRICPGDEGYSAPDDGESDGYFQAMWLAGFQQSRPMQGVADDVWARATVLSQGETSVGLVALDVVGFFYDDVLEVREQAKAELGLDYTMVVSTHVHEGPDTMGLWGPDAARSGVNPDHLAYIKSQMLDALRQAQAEQVAADVYVSAFSIPDEYWNGAGINNVNLDHRDPNIVDETVWTARFASAGTGDPIATWVNFPNHPEASSDENTLLTSDFAHTLRTTVEEGAAQGPADALPGTGGIALYLQGACGGMMTPLGADPIDLDGTQYTEHGIELAYAVGRVIGYHALQAIAAETLVDAPSLAVRTKTFFVPVENVGYHIMLNAGVIERTGYNYDPGTLISATNTPDLMTEVSLFELGGLAAITIPGELLPELAIGGYDGSHTGPLQELVSPGNPNPPDVAVAPAGPYLKDLMPGEVKMLFGLGNDEIGYIIPEYDYETHPTNPFLDEPPGDHYEETNSVGPEATYRISSTLERLMEFVPPER